VLAALRDAFVEDGELTERQGALLLAGSGAVFSVTAISVAAVDEADDLQFLTYRGASTACAMLLLVFVRRKGRPVSFTGVTPPTDAQRAAMCRPARWPFVQAFWKLKPPVTPSTSTTSPAK